jgi:hypothetical protein
MTNLPTCRHLLQPKKKKNLDVGFSWVAKNDDKPRSSLPFLSFFSSITKDNDKPRSRLLVVLGCFSSIAKDDNEPLGSSSFLSVFSSSIDDDDEPRS